MDEYIIINKTTLEKRIKELEKENSFATQPYTERIILKQILSQSTPLIPVIEDAFKEGRISCISSKSPTGIIEQQEYIENLKFDV